jgi:predicted SprT family Zn-dependent metalloprotease
MQCTILMIHSNVDSDCPLSTKLADCRHLAHVELSSKVIDSTERLRATLLHELCHVAAWVLPPHVAKPPHGPAFKRWASAAAAAYPDIPVTTCHTYDIHMPFQWQCESAG